MGLLATQGLTRCACLRLGCEPLSPSCKRIGGGKITCTHAPFYILRQLGEVLNLLFKLVQVGLGQMQGAHLLGLRGEGTTVSLLCEGAERITTHWRRGCLTGLAGMEFHQQANSGSVPAAFLKLELGSQASPLFRSRRAAYGDTEVYASGSAILVNI